jgi:hypothetical protein
MASSKQHTIHFHGSVKRIDHFAAVKKKKTKYLFHVVVLEKGLHLRHSSQLRNMPSLVRKH